MNGKLVIAVTAVLAWGLTACGAEPATENDKPRQAEDTAAPSSSAEAGAEDAATSIEITACVGAPTVPVGVRATVEVTNTQDKPVKYFGTVTFSDGSGADLGVGVFNTGVLPPGEKASEDIPGANIYKEVPTVSCELTDVQTASS